MGQDAFMEPLSSTSGIFQWKIYLLLLAVDCSGLKVMVPSQTVHGIRGQALYLPVHYGFHTPASDIQIIWLFERPHTMPKYLLGSVNESVVPDLEYQHKFTMMPPNASLLINPLQFTDEGNYIVKVNIQGNGTLSSSQKIQVTVDDPVTKPVVWTSPSSGAVEYVGNMTLACQVEGGTRLVYQWLKNGKPVCTSSTYSFSPQNNTLHISPVTKEDIGNYSCLVKNPVSEMESNIIMPTIYYGPYGLQVNSDKGLKVGEVFTVDLGEAILFDCSADSYPPNTYSWIRRTDNTTYVIKHGPHLEVASEKVAQKTTDYVCCAYNNITGRRDETRFTVIITSTGLEKLAQKGKSLSPLASITGISLFLIISMCLLFLWKKYQPYKAIKQKLEGRPETEYRRAQTFSGHEDALDDFGIYEFVAFPDASAIPRNILSTCEVHPVSFLATDFISEMPYEENCPGKALHCPIQSQEGLAHSSLPQPERQKYLIDQLFKIPSRSGRQHFFEACLQLVEQETEELRGLVVESLKQMPSRSIPASDGVSGQDLHSTIYEVIQHIPAQQQDHPE